MIKPNQGFDPLIPFCHGKMLTIGAFYHGHLYRGGVYPRYSCHIETSSLLVVSIWSRGFPLDLSKLYTRWLESAIPFWMTSEVYVMNKTPTQGFHPLIYSCPIAVSTPNLWFDTSTRPHEMVLSNQTPKVVGYWYPFSILSKVVAPATTFDVRCPILHDWFI